MKTIEKTLEYHELLMICENLEQFKNARLPEGFHFAFWEDENDLDDWVRIHLETGEFTSKARAKKIFYDFYSEFMDDLQNRCFFIVDSKTGEKVATSTVSPANEYGYNAVVDWLGIKKSYQGKKLGKVLITKTIEIARQLG